MIMTTDGWVALAVSILGNCSPDEAFRRLNGKRETLSNYPQEKCKWTKEEKEKIVSLKQKGLTWKEIAFLLNRNDIDPQKIRDAAYRAGYRSNKESTKLKDEVLAKIDNMRNNGMKWSEIGLAFNSDGQNIRSRWKYAKQRQCDCK